MAVGRDKKGGGGGGGGEGGGGEKEKGCCDASEWTRNEIVEESNLPSPRLGEK